MSNGVVADLQLGQALPNLKQYGSKDSRLLASRWSCSRLTRVLNAQGGRLTLKDSMTELAAESRGSDRSIAPITSLSVSYR